MVRKYSQLRISSKELPEKIIPYSPKMKVKNLEALPRGTGAKFLEVIEDHLGGFIAVQWKKTTNVDAPGRILIKFGK